MEVCPRPCHSLRWRPLPACSSPSAPHRCRPRRSATAASTSAGSGRISVGTAVAPGRRARRVMTTGQRNPRGRAAAAQAALPRTADLALIDGRTIALAAAVVLASGVVYVFTAARDIVVGDSPEFVTVAATLGVAHPPGYPLLTVIGHLF